MKGEGFLVSRKNLNVLLVEDDPAYSKLVEKALSRVKDSTGFNVICAKTFAAAIKHLGSDDIDIIILDIGLPDSGELEAIRGFSELNPDVPVIVLTGKDDQDLALSAIHEGARDYIIKQNFPKKSLPRIIRYAVEREYACERLRKNESQLRNMFAGSSTVMYRCLFDNDWTMKFISDSIKDIAGYEASDFVRNDIRSFESIIHPDDRFKVYDKVKSDLADENTYEVDYRIICGDGSVRWIKDSGQAVVENGEVKELNGALVDITEYVVRANKGEGELEIIKDELAEKNEKILSLQEEVAKTLLMLEVFETNIKIGGYDENLSGELKDAIGELRYAIEESFGDVVEYGIEAVETGDKKRILAEQLLSEVIESVHSVAAVKGVNIFKVFVEDEPLYIEQDRNGFSDSVKDILLYAVQCGYLNRSNVVVELNATESKAEVGIEVACGEDELESLVFGGFDGGCSDKTGDDIDDVVCKVKNSINGDVKVLKEGGKTRVSIRMDVFDNVAV